MKILVIGGGGREHALCWRLKQSASCSELHCAPGNAGIEDVAMCHPVPVEDIPGIVRLAQTLKIDFAVVGPDAPLVAGMADALRDGGIITFGPSKKAAQLEGSKVFMKDFCGRHNIPTAAYKSFTDAKAAHAYIDTMQPPVVVKTSGLAAGKGVIIAATHDEAKEAATGMLSGASFGAAGTTIVIEEFMDGEEISHFTLCSGTDYLSLGTAQDHKRVGDGDTGPNTGGMGTYSPARLATPDMEEEIIRVVVEPTLRAMAAEGNPFHGVLFTGLMVVDGKPKLLEFNVRFGDPECQSLMLRLQGDFAAQLFAAATGRLNDISDFSMSPQKSLCVVMAAQGYPGTYKKNTRIMGLDQAAEDGAVIFHAGTTRGTGGQILATGGRVLNVCAVADDVKTARSKAYAAVDKILWPEGFCRRDIAWRALE